MRKGKRWLSCLIIGMMLLSAAGCGNGNGEESKASQNDSGNGTSANSESDSGGMTDGGGEELLSLRGNTAPTQEEIDLVNHTVNDSYLGDVFDTMTFGSDYSAYPFKEEVTLDVWFPNDFTLSTIYPDLNEHPVIKQIEELTGININLIVPTLGEEGVEFNLMMQDGDLPDIIYDAGRYSGGVVSGVADGAYLEMTELIDQYMPNYAAIRASNESFYKDTMTDDGSVCAVYGVSPYPSLDWYCLMIKQEALDKTKQPVPETMDDWHDFLVACKEAGYTQPLIMDDFYGTYFTSVFSSPYGSYDWLYLDDEGKVAFGPTQEGTKEYLQVMQDWYNEGLINKDLVTGSREEHIASMISEESAAALLWMDYYDNEGIEYVVVNNPVLKKGDTPICTSGVSFIDTAPAAITSSCKNVEAACAFLDFGFSRKGWEMYNFGSYGDVHLIDENGMPYYHEGSLMYNDPEDMPYDYLKFKYRMHIFPNVRDDPDSNPATTSNDHVLNNRLYLTNSADHSHSLPTLSMTAEEVEKANKIGTNISTSRKEYFTKIVMGQLPVDAWDDFVAEAESFGLQEFLDIYQTAVDRYNERK